MRNRRLLERAAKAADIPIALEPRMDGMPSFCKDRGFSIRSTPGWWNPLTNNDDAFHLCVKLSIHINYVFGTDGKHVSADDEVEPIKSDACAATRRAIVRAAARMVYEP